MKKICISCTQPFDGKEIYKECDDYWDKYCKDTPAILGWIRRQQPRIINLTNVKLSHVGIIAPFADLEFTLKHRDEIVQTIIVHVLISKVIEIKNANGVLNFRLQEIFPQETPSDQRRLIE